MSTNNAPVKVGQMVKVQNDVHDGTYEVSCFFCNGNGWDVLLNGKVSVVPHDWLIPVVA